MSSSRIGVEAASLVCKVDSTMCPVMAARRPVSTVSLSRISPTSTMSGSCRSVERSTVENPRPIFSLTWTWVIPGSRYSIGSSTVTILASGEFIRASAPYSVVVLPEPVGPVTSSMPCANEMNSHTLARIAAGMPRRSSSSSPPSWGSSRKTADSPYCVGIVDIRRSSVWPRTRTTKRPSWGSRRSAMSSPADSFSRCTTAGAIRLSASVWTTSVPSIRNRICNLRSCGSTWISDARDRTASSNSDCNSLATGASSSAAPVAASSASAVSICISCSSSRARPEISSLRECSRSSVASRRDSVTTTRSRCRPSNR